MVVTSFKMALTICQKWLKKKQLLFCLWVCGVWVCVCVCVCQNAQNLVQFGLYDFVQITLRMHVVQF